MATASSTSTAFMRCCGGRTAQTADRSASLFRTESMNQLPDRLGELFSGLFSRLLVSALHDCKPPPTLGAAETGGGAAEPPS